jgi:DNA-directed RNA polymerase subunit K/omega
MKADHRVRRIYPDLTMERLREESAKIHPEVLFVERSDVVSAVTETRASLPYMTKYEFTAILSARKNQLANGASPMISLDGIDTRDPRFLDTVARQEIYEKKLPFLWICRRMPDNKNEFWCTTELEVMWAE